MESVIFSRIFLGEGTRWRNWLRHYATSLNVAGDIVDEAVIFFFFQCTQYLQPQYSPVFDSASNRYEYQRIILGGGGGGGGHHPGVPTNPQK
jgi:hypothetical protein